MNEASDGIRQFVVVRLVITLGLTESCVAPGHLEFQSQGSRYPLPHLLMQCVLGAMEQAPLIASSDWLKSCHGPNNYDIWLTVASHLSYMDVL